MSATVWPGTHERLGATPAEQGTTFAVWAPEASHVDVCLFDESGAETRLALPEHTLGVWHGTVPDVGAGQRYGYRASGAYDPAHGRRFNPHRLLLDPYARAVSGDLDPRGPVYDGLDRWGSDSARHVPKGVVVEDGFDWGDDRPPRTSWAETVVYEAHLRGLTMRHPDVPPQLRGTYAGLAHPAVVDELVRLGVTAVELLPVQQFASEPAVSARGLTNYWGYNTLGFFAPHAAYSSAGDRGGQVTEFKQLVRALHAAGLEVLLDVVYNHTAEGPPGGPTLSLRGLGDGAYYRQHRGGVYDDLTGCGNTLAVSHPAALRLVMDSLRYWVADMHVDGFRFDLASALARTDQGVDLNAPLLTAIGQDPVLREVKLVAEPWDATPEGYLVGRFPPPWCEWNDKYRDAVRDFWRGRADGVRDLASRLSGSSDLYADDGRLPFSSVNFVTAHDGFTLRDLVSYDERHNESNGEHGRDGNPDNRSWNCGVEGDTDDPGTVGLRQRQAANLLATLLLSTGVPMITAGDERGRTQRGNNNAYCHDSALSWVDWSPDPRWSHLTGLTRELLALRRRHAVLRQRHFFAGHPVAEGGRKDVAWFHPDGVEMATGHWHEPGLATLGWLLNGERLRGQGPQGEHVSDRSFLVWMHAGAGAVEVTAPCDGWPEAWEVLLDTSGRASRAGHPIGGSRGGRVHSSDTIALPPHTLLLLGSVDPGPQPTGASR
ncbi:MAG: glycogen debranching enzyme [Nocardioidaceae bacterium]|nr:glycogen debranching enzyme [Nocardioidaceae bacterium]